MSKSIIDCENFIPSKETLEKLRRALNGEYDTTEESTTATTSRSENQIKERNNQVDNYDRIFEGLEHYGYEIKYGKYTAVKPKNGSQFIRIKSLGEMYNEQALRNRVDNRNNYEKNTILNVNAVEDKNSLECRGKYAVYQYVIVFKSGRLPAKKLKPKMPFTFVNDAELDKLAALNKKINEGVTTTSLRNDLANSEKVIAQMEKRFDDLKNNVGFDKKLYDIAERWYTSKPSQRNRDDLEILERYGYTSDKYYSQKRATTDNETVIADVEKSISEERDKIKTTTETLIAFEGIMSMTYVQKLAESEKNRRQAKIIGNGVKSADISMADSMKVDRIAEKVSELVEQKIVEHQPTYKPPKPPRR